MAEALKVLKAVNGQSLKVQAEHFLKTETDGEFETKGKRRREAKE